MKVLGIPENNQIYCLIPLGYPLDKQGPVRRKPVKQVVFWNHWQQDWPFASEQSDEGWQERWIGGADKTSAATVS